MSEKKCPHCKGKTTCESSCCGGKSFVPKICTICKGTGTILDKK